MPRQTHKPLMVIHPRLKETEGLLETLEGLSGGLEALPAGLQGLTPEKFREANEIHGIKRGPLCLQGLDFAKFREANEIHGIKRGPLWKAWEGLASRPAARPDPWEVPRPMKCMGFKEGKPECNFWKACKA